MTRFGFPQNASVAVAMLAIVLVIPYATVAAEEPSPSTPAATAVKPEPLSLEGAIDLALEESPQVVASVATLEAAQAVAPSAVRLPDPELVVAIDNLPINTDDRFSFTRDFMTMRRIGVMQSFPNRAKRQLLDERARQEITLAEAELRKSRFDAARATSEAWIAVAVAEETRAILATLRTQAELQAGAARAALASGRGSAAEALAMQSAVARLDDRLAALEQEIESDRAELARWIGEMAERPLADIPAERELGRSADSLLAGISQHAPLAPLMVQLDAATTEVALARAEKRPDWSAELSYQNRGSDFSDMVSLEFRVGLPLFSGHRQDPVIAGKLASVRAQEAERNAEIRMHTAEVRAVLAEWRGGRERLKHYATELLPLASDRLHAAVSSYGAGRDDIRTVIEALNEQIDTQIEYVELEGAVARAWTFLHLLHDAGESP